MKMPWIISNFFFLEPNSGCFALNIYNEFQSIYEEISRFNELNYK